MQCSSFFLTGWHFHPWVAQTSGESLLLDIVQLKTEKVFKRLIKNDRESGDGIYLTVGILLGPRRYTNCFLCVLSILLKDEVPCPPPFPLPLVVLNPSKEDDEERRRFGMMDFGNECKCCSDGLYPVTASDIFGGDIDICWRMFKMALAVDDVPSVSSVVCGSGVIVCDALLGSC